MDFTCCLNRISFYTCLDLDHGRQIVSRPGMFCRPEARSTVASLSFSAWCQSSWHPLLAKNDNNGWIGAGAWTCGRCSTIVTKLHAANRWYKWWVNAWVVYQQWCNLAFNHLWSAVVRIKCDNCKPHHWFSGALSGNKHDTRFTRTTGGLAGLSGQSLYTGKWNRCLPSLPRWA